MFGRSAKTTHMLSDEEKEIVRLDAQVVELNSALAAEKVKSVSALSELNNKNNNFIAQGRKLERERLLKITRLAEFNGRETLAIKMALSDATGSSAESIGVMLRSSPKKETDKSSFELHMEALGNPQVGADFEPEYEASNNNPLELIAKGAI